MANSERQETATEATISVAVRIRPLTATEKMYLREDDFREKNYDRTEDSSIEYALGKENSETKKYKTNDNLNEFIQPLQIKKILDVVDDRMLIFDPKSSALEEIDNNITTRLSLNTRRSFSGNGIGRHNKRHKEQKFIFDRLFDEDSTQTDIYENTAKPSVDAVLDGYNSTIFAYGATGCGKTYTITGTPENPGIVFLALKELFSKIESQDEKNISIQVSYLEIYNEMIKDLLNVETNSKKLTLLENENKEIVVSNLTMVDTTNVEEVMDIIIRGNYNRTVSPTEANLTSSRSHAVLQVYITQNPQFSDLYQKSTRSVLSIIDLAGSERASATKNKGARLHEGANINKSLLALGNCINALCDQRRSTHVPYRNSKLTRLLKFSLGGNCKTVMIVCVSPSSRHYDETLNALKFANRAKEIKTKIVKNRTTVMKHVGSYMKIIADQKRRIYELETLMDSTVKKESIKFNEKRNNVKIQLNNMIERLWNNVKKCDHLKLEKIHIVAKRKILLVYIKQINDFYLTLNKLDVENRLFSLKNNLIEVLEGLKSQIISFEELYNQRTELDIILLETSEAFLKKLRELECWDIEWENLYNREVEYLKSDVEKQVFYESSILFDSMLSENDDIGNLNSIPNILARYICIIEDVAANLRTVEEARIECFQLADNLIKSCNLQLKVDSNFTSIELQNNTKKRKNSGNDLLINNNNIISESSFIRQGNRINSINNKLMRINLNNEDSGINNNNNDSNNNDSNNNQFNDSLSEIESSLILDTDDKRNKVSYSIRNSSQSNLLHLESTPQKDNIVDVLEEIVPFNERLDISGNDRELSTESKYIIQEEEDISNSSVIIRKEVENNSPANKRDTFIPSPLRTQSVRNKSEKLTSRKLIASPKAKITSPHRLVGFDSNSNNFQFKLRESMGGLEMFEGNNIKGINKVADMDVHNV